MATTTRHHSGSVPSAGSDDRSRPAPLFTVALATLVPVVLAAFTVGALLNSLEYTVIVLALGFPILILALVRNASRGRVSN